MEKMDTNTDAQPSTSKKTSDVDADHIRKQIAEAQGMSQKGNSTEALDSLLLLEKQCRLAEDMVLSQEVCAAILEVVQATGDWQELLNYITMLTKRRGQNKGTIQVIVRRAASMLDSGISKEQQVQLIKQLQAVTEGKIFLELDRARLTKRLAHMYEQDGQIAEAADALQEVAVETFGAMHRSEQIAFVLDQMRLCMANNDFTRAQILSRKVSPKAFAAGQKEQQAGEISLQGTAIEKPAEGTPNMSELKKLYYRQMIQFHRHNHNYIEIVRCLLALYADAKTSEDSSDWAPILKQIVWYLVLCPAFSTAEGSASDYLTLRASVAGESHLSEIPEHNDLLQVFITQEVTGVQALMTRYANEMKEEPEVFGGEEGAKRVEDLRKRVTEHNIMVVAKYYKQLRLERMSVLLGLPEEECEQHLSDLVVKKALAAKIDRVSNIVKFETGHETMQVLDKWGDSISKLLGLVETTCQKIQKESMQHNVPIGAGL